MNFTEHNLLDLSTSFATEEACEHYLINMRWPTGMKCTCCNGQEFYSRSKNRRSYQCRGCRQYNYPTAGTLFHRTRLPLQAWFAALLLVSADRRGVRPSVLADHLDLCYQTAWNVLQRIRSAMAQHESQNKLSGHVEMMEFASLRLNTEVTNFGKETLGPLLIAASLDTTAGKARSLRAIKLQAIAVVDKATLERFIRKTIQPGSTLCTERLSIQPELEQGWIQKPQGHLQGTFAAQSLLPSLAQFINGLTAGTITSESRRQVHLQAYMKEFSYRFNHRGYGRERFARLLQACCYSDKRACPP